jgi:hypothetical protein
MFDTPARGETVLNNAATGSSPRVPKPLPAQWLGKESAREVAELLSTGRKKKYLAAQQLETEPRQPCHSHACRRSQVARKLPKMQGKR